MKVHWPVVCLTLLLAPVGLLAEESPSSDEKAIMEAYMKAGTPGEHHKSLEVFVGTWNAQVKSWMAPGAEPIESTGTMENRWVLDGRWIEGTFTGSFMDTPFRGIAYTGYDNVAKQYVGSWMDTMSTGVMHTTGTFDGKAWKFTGSFTDPVTEKTQKVEDRISIAQPGRHVQEMYSEAPDGSMYKSMEIVYTRKK